MKIKSAVTGFMAIALFFAIQGAALASDELGEWQELISIDGKFALMMPGDPTFEIIIKDTAVGDIKENTYKIKAKRAEFIAAYLDLPFLARIFGRRIIFKRAKNGLLKEEKGEELSFINIGQNGLRGAELEFKTRKQRCKARFFLKKKTLYVLVAMVSKRSDDDGAMDKFLNSFRILSKKDIKEELHKLSLPLSALL